jgi:hypothetical protein
MNTGDIIESLYKNIESGLMDKYISFDSTYQKENWNFRMKLRISPARAWQEVVVPAYFNSRLEQLAAASSDPSLSEVSISRYELKVIHNHRPLRISISPFSRVIKGTLKNFDYFFSMPIAVGASPPCHVNRGLTLIG